MQIKRFENVYKDALIALIDSIYKEYGDQIYLTGFDKDLLQIEESYFQHGGFFWIITDHEDKIQGSIAIKKKKIENNWCYELKRFYLTPELRGGIWAPRLFKMAITFSEQNGIRNLLLWSDVRFKRAHQFYEKNGFKKGECRKMNDGFMPYTEYKYTKTI